MVKSKKKGSAKEYELIPLEENKVLQQRNETLIHRIGKTLLLIDDAEAAVKERDRVKHELAEWKAYLACDPFPKPFEIQALRKYFYYRIREEEKDIELTANWLLGVDERSILSQDFDMVDLTRRHLQLGKPDFGLMYGTRVNEAMTIARRIEDFLEVPTISLTQKKMDEMEEVKFLAFSYVRQYIESLSYRVLYSEEAYMNPLDSTSAEYAHKANKFDINIWTFKNVPIYLHPVDTPSKTIALNQIKVKMVLPFSVLCPNMVIRGLHCHFDHFSLHARFFDLPDADQIEQNIQNCLRNEWNTELEIQAKVTKKMIKERQEYEEAMRVLAEEEEKSKSRKAKSEDQDNPPEKKEKKKKLPKEPPEITPDLVPVVRADFLNHDFVVYEDAMSQFHPDTFGLTKGEINLRKYQILGGVYQINCLSKPTSVMFPTLIMGWYVAKEGTEYKNFETHFDPKGSKTNVAKFFQITFELPECYCLWGQPVPCLFEEGLSYRTANLPVPETTKTLVDLSPVIINDFNLHELFTKELMYIFLENTVPRFVSSFQFPEDLYDEEEDKKAKVKATLGRVKQTAEDLRREKELARQKQMLSYEIQKEPERLFPLMKKSLPVVILPRQKKETEEEEEEEELIKTYPYEYFSEFMEALLSIEQSYRQTKFRDRNGKPIKILAEKYASNIRRPRIDSKTILYSERTGSMEIQPSIDRSSSFRSSGMSLDVPPPPPAVTSKSTMSDHEVKAKVTKKKKGGKKKGLKENLSIQEIIDEDLTTPYSKWSTTNIIKSEVNMAARKVTIWTDRLGTFGFAFYRYVHFPFKSWTLGPDELNPDEVQLKIESEHALFRINVTGNGYRVSVTDFTKYVKSRKVYLEIKEPITDIKILKERMHEKYLNVFPERDAIWYLKGYFSEKHISAEFHTYCCMSLYALSLKFQHSIWNKLSNRRIMVMKFGETRNMEEDLFELCIQPEDVKYVEITELCSTLDTIELGYKPTWRNLEWYPDLNYLITSSYVNANEMRIKDPNVVYYLKNLLQAVRPFSCS